MEIERGEALVKVTVSGTISLPKQFRKYMDLQKGDYVRVILEGDQVIVRKAVIA